MGDLPGDYHPHRSAQWIDVVSRRAAFVCFQIPELANCDFIDHLFHEQTKSSRNTSPASGCLQARFYSSKISVTTSDLKLHVRRQDVADSLGVVSLPEPVASALASDVEYRIHQVIEVHFLISF